MVTKRVNPLMEGSYRDTYRQRMQRARTLATFAARWLEKVETERSVVIALVEARDILNRVIKQSEDALAGKK